LSTENQNDAAWRVLINSKETLLRNQSTRVRAPDHTNRRSNRRWWVTPVWFLVEDGYSGEFARWLTSKKYFSIECYRCWT